jgi:hypothetical protein
MKVYIQMTVSALVAMFVVSCSPSAQITNYGNVSGGGGGGRRVVRPASPRVVSDAIFRNQPPRPTPDVIDSTWGGTANTAFWANDVGNGSARIQPTSPSEPVLVSQATGFIWRRDCGNRVVPAEAPTQAVVENVGGGGGGGINQSIVQNTDYKLEVNMPITIITGGGGCYQPQQQYRPQQRYCPPRQQYRPQQRPMYRPQPQPRPCPPGTYRRY